MSDTIRLARFVVHLFVASASPFVADAIVAFFAYPLT